jgi:uncharacterized protein
MDGADGRSCEFIRRFFVTLSAGDLEALRPLIHMDGSWEVMRAVDGERLTVGRNSIIDDFLAPVRGRFEEGDPKVEVTMLFAAGNMVAAETVGTGQLRNGRPYRNRYAWIIELRDGLVCHVHEYMDTAYVRSVV